MSYPTTEPIIYYLTTALTVTAYAYLAFCLADSIAQRGTVASHTLYPRRWCFGCRVYTLLERFL